MALETAILARSTSRPMVPEITSASFFMIDWISLMYVPYPTTTSAASISALAFGVICSGLPGPIPTTLIRPRLLPLLPRLASSF